MIMVTYYNKKIQENFKKIVKDNYFILGFLSEHQKNIRNCLKQFFEKEGIHYHDHDVDEQIAPKT